MRAKSRARVGVGGGGYASRRRDRCVVGGASVQELQLARESPLAPGSPLASARSLARIEKLYRMRYYNIVSTALTIISTALLEYRMRYKRLYKYPMWLVVVWGARYG